MKTRFLLSMIALLFAGAVLFLSLYSAHEAFAENKGAASRQQLSFTEDVLPDNTLYPALMVMDRVQLETAPNSERIFLEMEYANRRLGYAQRLLQKDKQSLAISTLTKAENYLHQAAQDAQKLQVSSSVNIRIAEDLKYHSTAIQNMKGEFTDSYRSVLDKLIQENAAIAQGLH